MKENSTSKAVEEMPKFLEDLKKSMVLFGYEDLQTTTTLAAIAQKYQRSKTNGQGLRRLQLHQESNGIRYFSCSSNDRIRSYIHRIELYLR